jgi:hypothetical protein
MLMPDLFPLPVKKIMPFGSIRATDANKSPLIHLINLNDPGVDA